MLEMKIAIGRVSQLGIAGNVLCAAAGPGLDAGIRGCGAITKLSACRCRIVPDRKGNWRWYAARHFFHTADDGRTIPSALSTIGPWTASPVSDSNPHFPSTPRRKMRTKKIIRESASGYTWKY